MNIGIVCYPSIGGSGILATNLGLELAKLGHKVHFISYERPFHLSTGNKNVFFHRVNINTYGLFKYPDYTLPLAVTIGNVHEIYGLDVLHVHYAVPHATAALLAEEMIKQCDNFPPPKIITTLHGTDITLLARDKNLTEVIKYSIEKSDRVTAVSKYLGKQTRRFLKTKNPIEIIYNFYSPGPVTKSRTAVRKALGVAPNDFLAVHLSNLRPVKRIPDLLKTAFLVRDRRFKLLIMAGGDFTPYLPLLKKYRLEKTVIVKKGESGVENYLNAADMGLYASEEESFGLGILESMAFQKPVVATRAGGIPEVVENKKTGLLAPVGDAKAMAQYIKILMQDKDLSEKMGAAGKTRAEKLFSAGKIVQEYLKIYKRTP